MIYQKTRFPLLFLLACLATPALAHGQDMAVRLLFDGQPLQTQAPPDISCRDDNNVVWFACKLTRKPGTDGYVMPRPAPGKYTIHVEADENQDNPARFPGDYDVFQQFEVIGDTPALVNVDVLKVMHLTFPWDNNKSLDGMLTRQVSEKPVIETLPGSRTHIATVTFRWDAVVPGAEYSYVLYPIRDARYEEGPEMFRGTTRDPRVTLSLPLSPAGWHFAFELSAKKDGRPVGQMFTHDAGAQSWRIAFVVRDPSVRAARVAVVPKSDDAFLAEWKAAIPQPAWWDSVPRSPLAIHSLGDLMAVWQTTASDDATHRRFYKLTYQAILDHSNDKDLVAEGIGLMAFVADSDDSYLLLKFGVDHFFSYKQRTDNCANCLVGDTTGEMVRDLASAYISRGEHQAAIQIIRRLVNEREGDVSPYNLALTFEVMSRAYWELKDVEGARAAIQEGLRRFPNGWQADQLRRTLDRYEKEIAQPVDRPSPDAAKPL